MQEIWSGDRAVLTAVVELCETTGEHVQPRQVLDAFPAEEHGAVLHSLRRWGDHGYIDTLITQAMGQHGPHILMIKGVTEKGLRTSGAWPNGAELLTDRILEVLAERVRNEPEPESEKRSKHAAARGMGRDVLVDVVCTAIARSMPGG